VLVVDDNEDAASLLGTLLQEFGYATHVVHDGPAALSAAEQFDPQLALVDIGLPVMDGFEVAERFAEHPRLRSTKLIAVTGYGQHRDRELSARAGFAAHLVKPVDADQLRAVIAAVIGQDDNPA
jgi:CheY-like chemotaxis protein